MSHVLYKTFKKSGMKSGEEDHRFLLLSDFCIRGWVGKGGLWFYLFTTYSKKTRGSWRQRTVRRLTGKMVQQTCVCGPRPRCSSQHKNLKVVWPAVLTPDMFALKTCRLSCPQWDSLVSPSPGMRHAETTGVGGLSWPLQCQAPSTCSTPHTSMHPACADDWDGQNLCVVFSLKLSSFTTITYSPPSFFLLNIFIIYFRIYSQAEIFTEQGMACFQI